MIYVTQLSKLIREVAVVDNARYRCNRNCNRLAVAAIGKKLSFMNSCTFKRWAFEFVGNVVKCIVQKL